MDITFRMKKCSGCFEHPHDRARGLNPQLANHRIVITKTENCPSPLQDPTGKVLDKKDNP